MQDMTTTHWLRPADSHSHKCDHLCCNNVTQACAVATPSLLPLQHSAPVACKYKQLWQEGSNLLCPIAYRTASHAKYPMHTTTMCTKTMIDSLCTCTQRPQSNTCVHVDSNSPRQPLQQAVPLNSPIMQDQDQYLSTLQSSHSECLRLTLNSVLPPHLDQGTLDASLNSMKQHGQPDNPGQVLYSSSVPHPSVYPHTSIHEASNSQH
jgi:hypothetical protein